MILKFKWSVTTKKHKHTHSMMLPVFCFPEEWKKGNKQPSYVREFSESMPEIGILKLLCCWQQTGGQKRLGM
jgi:hypothetical protein